MISKILFTVVTLFFALSVQGESKVAPSFSAVTLEGVQVTYSSGAAKKPTLLIFWASWCTTCMKEIPELKSLYTQYSDHIGFLGVNLNVESQDGLAVQTQRALPYSSLSDPELKVADLFDVRGTPTLVVLDQQANILVVRHKIDNVLLDTLKSIKNNNDVF